MGHRLESRTVSVESPTEVAFCVPSCRSMAQLIWIGAIKPFKRHRKSYSNLLDFGDKRRLLIILNLMRLLNNA